MTGLRAVVCHLMEGGIRLGLKRHTDALFNGSHHGSIMLPTYKNVNAVVCFDFFANQFMLAVNRRSRVGYLRSALSMCSMFSGSLMSTILLPASQHSTLATAYLGRDPRGR